MIPIAANPKAKEIEKAERKRTWKVEEIVHGSGVGKPPVCIFNFFSIVRVDFITCLRRLDIREVECVFEPCLESLGVLGVGESGDVGSGKGFS
jgi:hypothetical protein